MGPLALPGQYQARLTVAAGRYPVPVEIKADPRVHASQADLEKQFELSSKIRERVTQLSDTVNQIRSLRSQLETLRKRLAGNAEHKPIASAAEDLNKKMTVVEEALMQVKSKSSEDPLNYPNQLFEKLVVLRRTVESADGPPTQQAGEVLEELSRKVEEQLVRWRELEAKDLAALNEMVRKENISMLWVAASPGK